MRNWRFERHNGGARGYAGRVVSLACAGVMIGLMSTGSAHAGVGTLGDSNGQIAAGGYNAYGETDVPTGNNYTAIAAGYYHGVALRNDGSLAAWGGSNTPAATNVSAGNNYTAIAAGVGFGLALRSDGSLAGWGYDLMGATNVPSGTDYVAVSAGGYNALALRSDGSLLGLGGGSGQIVPAGNNYATVDCGHIYSAAILSDGSLAGWGTAAQPDVPTGNNFTAISAGQDHSLALRSDGSLAAWGVNNSDDTIVPAGNNYTSIAAGYDHSVAIRSDGSLAVWGSSYGESPTGTFVAISAGYKYTLALRARTNYDSDLLVDGPEMGINAQLNRSVTVAGNASINTRMSLFNNPTLDVAGTTTIAGVGGISGTGTINGRVINHGAVDGSSGLTFGGLVSGEGSYSGHVSFAGGFSPGDGLGSVSVADADFAPTNTLAMEMGGTIMGSGYDHISATGTLHLGGQLEVVTLNGFAPLAGQSFDLFDFGSVPTGQFASVALPQLGDGLAWDTSKLYDTGEIDVVAVPEATSMASLGLAAAALTRRRRQR